MPMFGVACSFSAVLGSFQLVWQVWFVFLGLLLCVKRAMLCVAGFTYSFHMLFGVWAVCECVQQQQQCASVCVCVCVHLAGKNGLLVFQTVEEED
ncbi:hypothetical protein RHMOL_Rhmol04G0185200 [Rhododendron molle]|uniref:Uncharacterized protein n=1 Tax=Rhododendron molle TaxID=49168 RepID=A0ACC0P427_RHOML|nr:hypothetical protein RHMOL_Rhmol04G0185200 [Rhododendron molle]